MDYEHARFVLKVEVLVGLPGQPDPDRECYQAGELQFEGVQFCAIEYPHAGSSGLEKAVRAVHAESRMNEQAPARRS